MKTIKGYQAQVGFRKIAVNMPEEIFRKIKGLAEKNKTSFSDQALDLIKCGILDIEDSERHEPASMTA